MSRRVIGLGYTYKAVGEKWNNNPVGSGVGAKSRGVRAALRRETGSSRGCCTSIPDECPECPEFQQVTNADGGDFITHPLNTPAGQAFPVYYAVDRTNVQSQLMVFQASFSSQQVFTSPDFPFNTDIGFSAGRGENIAPLGSTVPNLLSLRHSTDNGVTFSDVNLLDTFRTGDPDRRDSPAHMIAQGVIRDPFEVKFNAFTQLFTAPGTPEQGLYVITPTRDACDIGDTLSKSGFLSNLCIEGNTILIGLQCTVNIKNYGGEATQPPDFGVVYQVTSGAFGPNNTLDNNIVSPPTIVADCLPERNSIQRVINQELFFVSNDLGQSWKCLNLRPAPAIPIALTFNGAPLGIPTACVDAYFAAFQTVATPSSPIDENQWIFNSERYAFEGDPNNNLVIGGTPVAAQRTIPVPDLRLYGFGIPVATLSALAKIKLWTDATDAAGNLLTPQGEENTRGTYSAAGWKFVAADTHNTIETTMAMFGNNIALFQNNVITLADKTPRLYYSRDSGDTWQLFASGVNNFPTIPFSISFLSIDSKLNANVSTPGTHTNVCLSDTVIAVALSSTKNTEFAQSRIVLSTDNGATWRSILAHDIDPTFNRLAVPKFDVPFNIALFGNTFVAADFESGVDLGPGAVYGGRPVGAGNCGAVYISNNLGDTWKKYTSKVNGIPSLSLDGRRFVTPAGEVDELPDQSRCVREGDEFGYKLLITDNYIIVLARNYTLPPQESTNPCVGVGTDVGALFIAPYNADPSTEFDWYKICTGVNCFPTTGPAEIIRSFYLDGDQLSIGVVSEGGGRQNQNTKLYRVNDLRYLLTCRGQPVAITK